MQTAITVDSLNHVTLRATIFYYQYLDLFFPHISHFFSRLIFVLQIFINFFLTSFSLLGQYWENLALDRSCTDRAELGSYKNDPGPLFFSTARASEVKRCFRRLTELHGTRRLTRSLTEDWPKIDRRLTELHGTRAKLADYEFTHLR